MTQCDEASQRRVDAASDEMVQFALDCNHDLELQKALFRRMEDGLGQTRKNSIEYDEASQRRVDAASDEMIQFALDCIHDLELQKALFRRMEDGIEKTSMK